MPNIPFRGLTGLAAFFCSAALLSPAMAADAVPPADPGKPVTTARVGGSPADAAFRDAQQKSGADFRAARTVCKARLKGDRSACLTAARNQLKDARLAARAAHDAARK